MTCGDAVGVGEGAAEERLAEITNHPDAKNKTREDNTNVS
jgi:hypothetical protein